MYMASATPGKGNLPVVQDENLPAESAGGFGQSLSNIGYFFWYAPSRLLSGISWAICGVFSALKSFAYVWLYIPIKIYFTLAFAPLTISLAKDGDVLNDKVACSRYFSSPEEQGWLTNDGRVCVFIALPASLTMIPICILILIFVFPFAILEWMSTKGEEWKHLADKSR
jgi:hypothetical protein